MYRLYPFFWALVAAALGTSQCNDELWTRPFDSAQVHSLVQGKLVLKTAIVASTLHLQLGITGRDDLSSLSRRVSESVPVMQQHGALEPRNKFLWCMAAMHFFVYLMRQGVMNWAHFYLMDFGVRDTGGLRSSVLWQAGRVAPCSERSRLCPGGCRSRVSAR